MLSETVLRRHARIPPDDRLIRFLVILPERTARPPQARAVADPPASGPRRGRLAPAEGESTCARGRHVERPTLDDLEPLLGLDPRVERTGEQLTCSASPPGAALPGRDSPAPGPDTTGALRRSRAQRHRVCQEQTCDRDPHRPSTPSRSASGSRSSSSIRRPPRCTATLVTTTASTTRGPPDAPRSASSPRTPRRSAGHRSGRALDRGPHHPRHPDVIAELRIEEDDAGDASSSRRRPDRRTAAVMPQLTTFQPRRHARAPGGGSSSACAPTGRTWPPTRSLREGIASGLTAPDRDRAHDRADRAPPGHPARPGGHPGDRPGRVGRRPRAHPRGRPRRRRIRPTRPTSTPLGRVPRDASREEPGSGRRPTASALPPRDPRLDDARPGPADVHQIGLDELASIDAGAARDRPRRGLRRRPVALPAARSPTEPRTRRDAVRSSSRARGGHRPGQAVAPRVFGRLPRAAARSGRSRSSRRRTRRSRTTTRRRSTAPRPGIYYVNSYDLPSRTYPSSPRRRTTRRYRATTSRSRSRWSTRSSTCSGGWARGSSAAPTSRAGACTRAARRRDGPVPDEGERLGMLDAQAWRAARLVVDSGHARARAGRASSRSTSCSDAGLSEHRRGDRDRPLHRVARPGAHLHDRAMREIGRLRARDRGARRRRGSTSARSTTRLIGPRLPAAGHAHAASCPAGSRRADAGRVRRSTPASGEPSVRDPGRPAMGPSIHSRGAGVRGCRGIRVL